MEEKNKISQNERKILIFKYMIQFLEIFGMENYGASAEVDWEAVFNNFTKCGIFDFNFGVEDLVVHNSDNEFRDNVFKFVENQVLDGYPVWRLFHMSEWLRDKCEQELLEREHCKDVEFFNKTKCLHCKYFEDELEIAFSHELSSFDIGYYKNIDEFKAKAKHMAEETMCGAPKVKFIKHHLKCNKRIELLHEMEEEFKSKHPNFSRFDLESLPNKFKYKKFNLDDASQPNAYTLRSHSWILQPEVLKKCGYFEENSEMTPEKFEELYDHIPR